MLDYEVCAEFDVEPEQVEAVIQALQSLDPPGIGARDIRECMVLQLKYLEARGERNRLAIPLVEEHLEDLGKHKFNKIASDMSVDTDEVEEAWDFVKSKLNPHPAQSFEGTPTRNGPRPTQGFIIPDVIISIGKEGLEVEVIESRRFALSINGMYQQLLQQATPERCPVLRGGT